MISFNIREINFIKRFSFYTIHPIRDGFFYCIQLRYMYSVMTTKSTGAYTLMKEMVNEGLIIINDRGNSKNISKE